MLLNEYWDCATFSERLKGTANSDTCQMGYTTSDCVNLIVVDCGRHHQIPYKKEGGRHL